MNAQRSMVRIYDNPKDFQKEVGGELQGWAIVDVTKWAQKAGWFGALFFPLYRLVRPRSQQLVVSYSQPAIAEGQPA